jgi:hypothetical protein
MTNVLVRVFALSVLPVLLAALHVRLSTEADDRLRKLEVYLIFVFFSSFAGGVSGFFGHIFLADAVADSIDWARGSPFQQEMAFANLALGVLALMSVWRRDGFREATVIAITVVGVGATIVHVVDFIEAGNLAPGNSIQSVANLVKPALLIPLLRMSRASEDVTPTGPSFDEWRHTVIGPAGAAIGVIGAGFGIGYSIEYVIQVTLLAAVLAGLITVRSVVSARSI